jgi:DNA-directed RNA polymerase subunit L
VEVKFIEKKKDVIELEFDEKTLPNALLGALTEKEVDAYVYEPHPLIKAYRLHIEASDAMKVLKAAVDTVEGQWAEFGKLLKKELASKK